MTDLRHTLERFETTAAECQMIAELATDYKKRELYLRLALHNRGLASETRKVITARNALQAQPTCGYGARR